MDAHEKLHSWQGNPSSLGNVHASLFGKIPCKDEKTTSYLIMTYKEHIDQHFRRQCTETNMHTDFVSAYYSVHLISVSVFVFIHWYQLGYQTLFWISFFEPISTFFETTKKNTGACSILQQMRKHMGGEIYSSWDICMLNPNDHLIKTQFNNTHVM